MVELIVSCFVSVKRHFNPKNIVDVSWNIFWKQEPFIARSIVNLNLQNAGNIGIAKNFGMGALFVSHSGPHSWICAKFGSHFDSISLELHDTEISLKNDLKLLAPRWKYIDINGIPWVPGNLQLPAFWVDPWQPKSEQRVSSIGNICCSWWALSVGKSCEGWGFSDGERDRQTYTTKRTIAFAWPKKTDTRRLYRTYENPSKSGSHVQLRAWNDNDITVPGIFFLKQECSLCHFQQGICTPEVRHESHGLGRREVHGWR